MDGSVCVVTGATSGLGLATARALAARGATVVMVGRDAGRCEAAAADVRGAARDGRVDWLVADFASMREVRDLASEIERRHERLDVLINNAGAVFQRRRLSPDGIEMTLAVNYLAHFLLTGLLLEQLRANAPARIVNIASSAHSVGSIDFDDMRLERRYRPFRAYARAKLANVLFTYELARRLPAGKVTANAVHPGLVRTALGEKSGRIGGVVWRAVLRRHRRVAVSPEEGAESIVFLATSPTVATTTGRYFVDGRPAQSAPASYDAATATRLWRVSEELTREWLPARPTG